MRGRILDKWQVLATVLTPDGDDAQAHLEQHMGEQTAIPASQGGFRHARR